MGDVQNPKLRPALERAPKVAGQDYYYYPSMVTAVDDVDRGEWVELVEPPEGKRDKTVKVRKQDGEVTRVFWTDLRL